MHNPSSLPILRPAGGVGDGVGWDGGKCTTHRRFRFRDLLVGWGVDGVGVNAQYIVAFDLVTRRGQSQ